MLISQDIMSVICMICQVRAISSIAKNLCAKSLLNLMNPDNFGSLINDNVIRCVASIVSNNTLESTAHVSVRVFLILTSVPEGRAQLGSAVHSLQHLFGLINSDSLKTHVVVSKALCNMLCDEKSRYASLQAGALTVLKIVATLKLPNVSELIAQTLITISMDETIHTVLLNGPVIGILNFLINNSTGWAFECSLNAAAVYASIPVFRMKMIERGIVVALVKCGLSSGLSEQSFAEPAIRCLTFLSFAEQGRELMVIESNTIIALLVLSHQACSYLRTASMVVLLLRNLSIEAKVGATLIEQKCLRLLGNIFQAVEYKRSFAMCQASVIVLKNLALQKDFHEQLIGEGILMKTLLSVASLVSDEDEDGKY